MVAILILINLGKLLQELSNSAAGMSDARRGQDGARLRWDNLKKAEVVSTDLGTLGDFLQAHSNDFSDFRYYDYGGSKNIRSLAILAPLAKRHPETWTNLLQFVSKT